MAMQERPVLDMLGTYCPIPVIETRRLIHSLSEPLEVDLLTDDPEALIDIPALLKREGGAILAIGDHEPIGWCMTLLLEPPRDV